MLQSIVANDERTNTTSSPHGETTHVTADGLYVQGPPIG